MTELLRIIKEYLEMDELTERELVLCTKMLTTIHKELEGH